MAARLLRAMLGQDVNSGMHIALQKQAKSIADNRVYAGLHYPVDSVAGQVLGETLAEYVLSRCSAKSAKWTPRRFEGTADALGPIDFAPLDDTMQRRDLPWLTLDDPVCGAHPDPVMAHLWAKARQEWQDIGFTSEA